MTISLQSKIEGAVLGAAIGDAMRQPTESLNSFDGIFNKYGPQGITGFELFWTRAGAERWPSAETLTARTSDLEWVRLFTGGSNGALRMWTKTVRNLLAETVSIVASYDLTPEEGLVATLSPNHIRSALPGGPSQGSD